MLTVEYIYLKHKLYFFLIQVKAFLQPPMRGVVLQSYGAGNGPDGRAEILALLKEACDRGVLIVNISQCAKGRVSPGYATGKVQALKPHNHLYMYMYGAFCVCMVLLK